MPINVSEALDTDTAEVVTVHRRAPGSYVDGLWVPGAVTTFTTVASVQQPTMKQLQFLPEGERASDALMLYSKKKLFTVGVPTGQEPDVVEYQGGRYHVIAIGNWSAYGHTDGVMVLEKPS